MPCLTGRPSLGVFFHYTDSLAIFTFNNGRGYVFKSVCMTVSVCIYVFLSFSSVCNKWDGSTNVNGLR